MPLALFSYFLVEALAFYGVAKLVGVGWALFWIFALMVLGALLAGLSMRSALVQAAHGRSSVSKLAGDSALLLVGWVLSVVPGFATSIAGLLLIFGPTRGLIRRSLTAKVQRDVEDFSARVYNASPMARRTTNYGHFGPAGATASHPGGGAGDDSAHPVIDADELEEMYRMESPQRRDNGWGQSPDQGPDQGPDQRPGGQP